MSSLLSLSNALCSVILLLSAQLCAAEDTLWLEYTAAEGNLRETVAGEMPDYTIDREWAKHRSRYSYISPVQPNRPTSAVTHLGLRYGSEHAKKTLDLVLPQNTEEPAPLILMIHGGGWRTGQRAHFLSTAKAFAERGYAAATVSYRTSKEALYPAGMRDLEQALSFLLKNAEPFNLDASFIGLLGGSSGAHMASLLGVRLNEQQPKLIDVVLNFDGIVETESEAVRYHEDRPGKLSYLSLWLGGRTHEAPQLWKEVSPLRYASDVSPAFVFINSSHPRFHAGRDELITRLHQFDIPTLVHEIPDTPHTFWLFSPWVEEAIDTSINFLTQLQANKALSVSNDAYLRVDRLPADERDIWKNYIDTSDTLRALDQGALRNADTGDLKNARVNRYNALSELPADQVTNLLSFQTPSGGWSKNTDFLTQERTPDKHYGIEPSYVPTFDNGATTSELKLLAQLGEPQVNPQVKAAIERGFTLIFTAQMPNGGWPQSFPLRGSYHDLCTHNDNVTANILDLLIDAQQMPNLYPLSELSRAKLQPSIDRAVAHLLDEQIWLNASEGAWGQQHDPIQHTLVSARSFEPAALATTETANLVYTLMRLANPSAALIKAIDGAVHWLENTKISNTRLVRYDDRSSELVHDPQAPDLWPRFIHPASGVALFGDRNGRQYYSIRDISLERQHRYGWYQTYPERTLEAYTTWSATR